MPSPQDVYVANLRQSFGYPLHAPEPRGEPKELYLKQGFQIGDVGYIDEKGAFNPLFNVCFHLPEELRDRGFPSYKPVTVVDKLQKDVVRSLKNQVLKYGVRENLDTKWLYAFTASSTQGAILILPSDVAQYELRDKSDLAAFRKLATEYACLWCERSGKDSLYLVTGTHATSTFHLAAFDAGVVNQEIRVQPDDDNPGTYKWKSEFLAYSQIGPQNNKYENQTIFIKGFRMTVRWSWLAVIERVTGFESPIMRQIASLLATLLAFLEALFLMANGWLSRTTIEHVPHSSQLLHPSDMINRYLLDKNPGASAAITHDDEWLDILEKNKLSREDLIREDCLRDLLEERYTSYSDHGVVYLESQTDSLNAGDVHHNSASPRPRSATEKMQIIIKHIRAENVTTGLGRVPVGFYVQVNTDGRPSRRTKNKSVPVYDSVIQWDDPICLPSDPSVMVELTIIASFGFDPMLGRGEPLYTLEKSVGELLQWNQPFTFSDQQAQDCRASLLVSVQEWRGNHRMFCSSIVDEILDLKEISGLTEATDQGHDALLRYYKDHCEQNLKCSVTHFERAVEHCPGETPLRGAALFNLATAEFITYQSHGTTDNFNKSISFYRKALAVRCVDHQDRPMTLLCLAQAILYRYGVVGEGNTDELCKLVNELRNICPEGTHARRAADLVLQTYERLRIRDSNDFGELEDLISKLDIAAQEPPNTYFDRPNRFNNLGLALQRRFQLRRNANDLDRAIEWLEKAVQITPNRHPCRSNYLSDLGNALLVRFQRQHALPLTTRQR